MSPWRQVKKTLYDRWAAGWVDDADEPLTPYTFANEKLDPPKGYWARFTVQRMPGGPGTLGRQGNRKMDRRGRVFIQLYGPVNAGDGPISDLADKAAKIFENCRILAPFDIRFAEVEPGPAGEQDNGRLWGVTVDGPFDYEETR